MARGSGSADVSHNEKPDSSSIFSGPADTGLPLASQGLSAGPSNQGTSAIDASDRGGEEYDIFGDNDEGEGETAKSSKGNGFISHENGGFSQPSISSATASAESKFIELISR